MSKVGLFLLMHVKQFNLEISIENEQKYTLCLWPQWPLFSKSYIGSL